MTMGPRCRGLRASRSESFLVMKVMLSIVLISRWANAEAKARTRSGRHANGQRVEDSRGRGIEATRHGPTSSADLGILRSGWGVKPGLGVSGACGGLEDVGRGDRVPMF